MSRRTRDFSFLSQMEPCTYSKEVVELGRQIVEELKLKGEGIMGAGSTTTWLSS